MFAAQNLNRQNTGILCNVIYNNTDHISNIYDQKWVLIKSTNNPQLSQLINMDTEFKINKFIWNSINIKNTLFIQYIYLVRMIHILIVIILVY